MTRADGERRPRPAAAKVAPAPRSAEPEPVGPSMSGNPALSTNPAVPRATGGSKIVPPEEMLADIRNFVRDLAMSDKLAFLGAVATVLLEFVPWRTTAQDGDVIGLVTSGFLVLLAALVTMAAVAVRVRKTMPHLNPLAPWLAQLGTSAFCVLFCLLFMKLNFNGQKVQALEGNLIVSISTPAFGVVLAFLSSTISLAGTLMGLKEKPH